MSTIALGFDDYARTNRLGGWAGLTTVDKVATATGWLVSALAGTVAPYTAANTMQPAVLPASNVQWDNAIQQTHPAMQSEEVQKFQRAMFYADAQALRDIYDLVFSNFDDVPGVSLDYSMDVSYDTQEPKLFLMVNTHGMPMEEQMAREERMHSAIRTHARLYKATDYHCITVV